MYKRQGHATLKFEARVNHITVDIVPRYITFTVCFNVVFFYKYFQFLNLFLNHMNPHWSKDTLTSKELDRVHVFYKLE